VWDEEDEKAGDSNKGSEMLQMWREGAQEVGVPANKKEKERGGGTTMSSVKESEGALWNEGAAPKRSNNVYRRVDDTKRGSDLGRI